MGSSEAELTHAGQAIRRALDGESDPSGELREARAALLDRVATRSGRHGGRHDGRPRMGRRAWALGAAVAVAASSAVLWTRLPISFQVAGAPGAGKLGDVVEAGGTTPLALRFSEGSAIALHAGARVRVLTTDAAGARVLIETGGLDIAVAHRKARATRWRFEAGPFKVAVTGTKFHVNWNPTEQAFALDTTEGSVVVSAPCLPRPRTIAAGETLTAVCPAPAPESMGRPADGTSDGRDHPAGIARGRA